jgi:hypothetical protein
VGERGYNVYRPNKRNYIYIYDQKKTITLNLSEGYSSGPLGLSMFFGGVQHSGYRPYTYLGLKTWKDL